MPESAPFLCPLCGNMVTPGSKKCSVCGTPIKTILTRRAVDGVIAKRIMGRIESDRASRERVFEKLPEVKLPAAKVQCPSCGLELEGAEASCKRCGVPLATGEDIMLECPQCGTKMPAGSASCPKCGVAFSKEGEEAETPAKELEEAGEEQAEPVPPPPPQTEVPGPEAVTPPVKPDLARTSASYGLVNGRGAVNGTGLVNGRGAVNGTGLVNGTGMINGTKGEGRQPEIVRRRTAVARWQVLAVLVAVVVVISTFAFLSYSGDESPNAVDGDFDEWSDVVGFGMRTLSVDPGVSIADWAIIQDENKVHLYALSDGELMGSTVVDVLYLFIDADESSLTGYRVSGIGADYMLQVAGWNGSVQSSSTKEFGSSTDVYDWNQWREIGSVASALEGDQLEAMAELPVAPSESARYFLVAQNQLGDRSVSYPVPLSGGLLIVEQQPSSQVSSSGIVPVSSSAVFMTLRFTCEGAGGTVSAVPVDVTGSADAATTVNGFDIALGGTVTVDYLLDTQSSSAPGDFVSAAVTSSGIVSSFKNVVVVGEGAKAYVGSSPASISVDGAFADWEGRTLPDSDLVAVGNLNIDIDEIGANATATDSYFFVSVFGEMCSGSYVPSVLAKPVDGGGNGVVVPTRKTGEDFLRVYIDSDKSSATGFRISLSDRLIGAEYMVEVIGLDGQIADKRLKSYVGGTWIPVGGAIDAAKDTQRIEIGIAAATLGGAAEIDFIVETTDWRSRKDLASWDESALSALTGGISFLSDLKSWVVSGTTSSAATAMSYQRKMFFDGTNFWSFYFDGSNTVYRYSTDGGATWTLVGSCFKATGVNKVSIWYDPANDIVYAVGDTSAAVRDVYLQRGVVSPGTSTIAWAASDSTLRVSGFNLPSKNTFISKDADGYLWVASSNQTSQSPDQFNASVFRSTAVDSIGSWSHSTNLLAGSYSLANCKASVVPKGTGSDMWAVYTYAGLDYSREYISGSWGAEISIPIAVTTNPANTDLAPPSVVVDSSGVAHVVYGDGRFQGTACKPQIFYTYNSGSGWSAGVRLDVAAANQGNLHPTISLDLSTGNLFAFWIQTDSTVVGRTVVGKKNVGGVWTQLDMGTQTTDQKQFLTSVYSVPSESYVCWQWTQNTSAPIQVIFDKIPEFTDVVVPVLFMLVLFVVMSTRAKSRRSKQHE